MQEASPQAEVAPTTAPFPLQETFKLHSLPSASKRIYLDFDGHTTTGTAWNNGGTIVTPAYTVDGSPSFSDSELKNIQDMWSRVSEDFSPFDVDVTTEEPSIDDLRKVGAGDTRWGIRVVIGQNTGGLGGGGIAFLGSFNSDSDTPCFVFPELLDMRNSIIALATSHEVGHSLGLDHDGSPAGEYYGGHGTGPTSWGPIMGNPDKGLTQWSKGEYAGATNKQDDLAIIIGDVKTRYTPDGNGFGYRADDYGDDINAPEPVVSATKKGVIERNDDVDVFSFATSGRINVTVKPIDVGANLDIMAEIVDATSKVVATSNPAGAIDASFSLTVTAGTYYLRVRGSGEGDPLGVGYTNYGSLGQYTATFSGVNPPPEIVGISIAGVVVGEGNDGESVASVTVTLSKASEQVVTVDYDTKDGTAKAADDDYVPSRATITFQPGETTKTVALKIVGDEKYESDEKFSVVLSNAVGGYVLDGGVALCTIQNDDQPVTRIQVLPAVVSEAAAGFHSVATFRLRIDGDVLAPFSVTYATRDGSAKEGSDYRGTSGTIRIMPGQAEQQISVGVSGDGRREQDETFSLVLTAVGTTDPVTGTSGVNFVDVMSGLSARGGIVARGMILDQDSRFFTTQVITRSAMTGSAAKVAVGLARLPQYGPVLPDFGGVPSQFRDAISAGIRFSVNVSVREGVRGQESATAIFGVKKVDLGYVSDGSGSMAAKTTAVLEGVAPLTARRQTFVVRLADGTNARVGGGAGSFLVTPARSALFASLAVPGSRQRR